MRPKENPLTPEEDKIKPVSYIPLVDCDPAIAVKFLKLHSWPERVSWFEGILIESFTNWQKMLEIAECEEDAKRQFSEIAMLGMHHTIAEILDGLGEVVPVDDDALTIFALSSDIKHRLAAREYCNGHEEPTILKLTPPQSGRRFLYAMSEAMRPGLDYTRRQIGKCSCGRKREKPRKAKARHKRKAA